MIELDDVRAAAARIGSSVRRTPLIGAAPMQSRVAQDFELVMKLECLQVTGSFKARGAISKLKSLSAAEVVRGLVTASGGNHGAAVAYAGWVAGTPATVFVPENVAPLKAQKIESWGAKLEVEGSVWDESNRAALALARERGMTYVHPFADPAVMAGQGTVALEILEDDPDIDTLLIAIGGGGLISGIAVAVKALKPGVRIIGVEPTGAPTLYESVRAGRVVELAAITTVVPTMAARKTEEVNLDLVQRHVEDIVLVTDDEMRETARLLWLEHGLAVDLSGAASLALLVSGKFRPRSGEKVCALICGAGSDGLD
ncbi:MAG TPA: threonine/serine dehydratase [Geminicoccaceae bacterium]|nr:threonine/serine dehydratase [Geminicoccaceae bacterium]